MIFSPYFYALFSYFDTFLVTERLDACAREHLLVDENISFFIFSIF